MAELPEGVKRWVMRVVERRKQDTGEEWADLRETPHPEGEWIKVEDLPAIEAAVVERIREGLDALPETNWYGFIRRIDYREFLATLDQERADG